MGRRHHRASSIMYQFAVLLFIATFPIICSSAATDTSSAGSGATNDDINNNHHHHPHRRRHHQQQQQSRTNIPVGTGAATDHPGVENSKGETDAKVLAGYSDSYITKQAALNLQEKLRQLHHRVTDEEYNALLQQFVSRPKSDPSHPIFDKMYYDYLPSEAAASEAQPKDSVDGEQEGIDLTDFVKNKRKKPFKKVHHHEMETDEQQHQGERRSKRAVPEHGHEIGKRQAGVWTNQYQRQETRRTYSPPQQFVSATTLDHDYDDQSGHYTAAGNPWAPVAAVPHYQPQSNAFLASYNSPWKNRGIHTQFTLPQPNNYYLPAVPPPEFQYIVRPPFQPWMRFPIPGVVYNPAFPPKNPPVMRPDSNSIAGGDKDDSINNNQPNIPNRFGGDDEQDRFIWDVVERTEAPPQRRPVQPVTQPPRSPTRRPPPPLIRDTDNAEDTEAEINSIFGINRPATNNRPPPPVNNVRPQQQPWTPTRRPPPPLIRNTDEESTGQPTNQFESPRPSRPQFTNPTRQPPRTFTTTTTPKPTSVQQDDGPSVCVWAIVNCCSPSNRNVRYSCFERFGCGGAFWDINPCNEDVFDSAVDIADQFVA